MGDGGDDREPPDRDSESGPVPERDTERLRKLHHAAGELSAASTAHEAYEIAVKSAERLLAFDSCEVFEHQNGRLRLVAASNHATLPDETYDVDGVLGESVQEDRTVVVEDARDTETVAPFEEDYRSAVSVPISDTAVLRVISTEPRYFDRHDTEIVELLVSHVEAAIERIDTERQLREQKRQVEQLHAVATELETCHTHEALFDLVIDAASEVLGFEWCGMLIVEDGQFVTAAVSESTPVEVGERFLSVDEGIAGWAYRNGEADYTGNTFESDRSKPVDDAFQSSLVVPIGDVGVLNAVSSEPDAFGPEDIELAELLAGSVLEAYDRIEIQQQLRKRQQELDLLKQVQSRILRHNIRNDLSVIQAMAARLKQEPDADTAPLAQKIIDKSESLVATSEKARQIEQVLEQEETATMNLASVTEGVVSSLQSEFPSAVIETDLEPVHVRAHPDLGMAVHNIVENAIVHNTGTPRIHVSVQADDRMAVCRVADNGTGIPDHETAVLDRNRETDLEHGSGAGLWLVRWIVDRSGGSLSFDRTEDGTVVELKIPRSASS